MSSGHLSTGTEEVTTRQGKGCERMRSGGSADVQAERLKVNGASDTLCTVRYKVAGTGSLLQPNPLYVVRVGRVRLR